MISVIIPVYNCEKWIGRCLDSIICQSYSDLEIIVIDDGSDDGSYPIIKEYSQKDGRIKIHSNSNHGVGFTRNYGISLANGEYIAFVDSDDYVESDYFEKLIQPMSNTEIDLVISGYKIILDKDGKMHEKSVSLNYDVANNLKGILSDEILEMIEYINSPCLKLYRLSIINEFHIQFPDDMKTGEDLAFNLEYYEHVRKYKYIKYEGYCYYQNDASVTHSNSPLLFECALRVYRKGKAFLVKYGVKNAGVINAEWVYGIVQRYVSIDENDSLKRYLMMMDKLEDKRSFKILDSKRKTVILFLYKFHLLWLYYYIARCRRKRAVDDE